jgi:hypothetical protein
VIDGVGAFYFEIGNVRGYGVLLLRAAVNFLCPKAYCKDAMGGRCVSLVPIAKTEPRDGGCCGRFLQKLAPLTHVLPLLCVALLLPPVSTDTKKPRRLLHVCCPRFEIQAEAYGVVDALYVEIERGDGHVVLLLSLFLSCVLVSKDTKNRDRQMMWFFVLEAKTEQKDGRCADAFNSEPRARIEKWQPASIRAYSAVSRASSCVGSNDRWDRQTAGIDDNRDRQIVCCQLCLLPLFPKQCGPSADV